MAAFAEARDALVLLQTSQSRVVAKDLPDPIPDRTFLDRKKAMKTILNSFVEALERLAAMHVYAPTL